MKYNFVIKFTSFLMLCLFVMACDEDLSTVGGEIIDIDPDNGFTIEEIDVIAYSEKINAVQVSGLPGTLLGVNNDAVYGNRIHNVLSQVMLSSYNPNFGENPKLEKVTISIPYFSTVTATNVVDAENTETTYKLDSIRNGEQPIKLSVFYSDYFLRDFEVANPEKRKVYFSKDENLPTAAIENKLLVENMAFVPGNKEFVISTPACAATEAKTTRIAPQYRVEIDAADDPRGVIQFFKDRILDKQGSIDLSNATNFRAFFRGIYLKAEAIDDKGNLMYLDLSRAKIDLTYTFDNASVNELEECEKRIEGTLSILFGGNIINSVTPAIGAQTIAELDNPDKEKGAQQLYLKGGEGAIGVVELFKGENEMLPELLREDNIILNDAYLKFYVDETKTGEISKNENRIYIYNYDTGAPLADFLSDPNLSQLGELERDGNAAFFKINITQHIKNIIYNGTDNVRLGICVTSNVELPLLQGATVVAVNNGDNGTTVLPVGAVVDPDGLVIHGNASPDVAKKLKLNIVYTKPIN